MLSKRIIPCLDIKDGQTVKGVNFENLRFAGDPVKLAKKYCQQKADELVFLDITATNEGRETTINMVDQVASQVFIPLTVGGGIKTIDDMCKLLNAGADKIAINSSAVKNPQLIEQACFYFGSQCIVVAIDAKRDNNGDFFVFINAGKQNTGIKLTNWVLEVQKLGAGEILLTSMDTDGTQNGFDIEMTKLVCNIAKIPVIASAGAGPICQHFIDVFDKTNCDAALAASIFHFDSLSIPDLKDQLKNHGFVIR